MHIPDGYLGPATCGFFYAVMLPIWVIASRIAKSILKARQVPFLAMAAAFSFVIMMFNFPIPGCSTGHAMGAVLIAILLGPWLACIAITVVLVVQALLFADGGISALGANCFNMAFAQVFVGYYIYKAASFRSAIGSNRRLFAAGLAAYIGINIAAFLTSVELGIQPLLYRTAGGQALYSPYSLDFSVPIMVGGHVLIVGWVEAAVTVLVIKFLQNNPAFKP